MFRTENAEHVKDVAEFIFAGILVGFESVGLVINAQ